MMSKMAINRCCHPELLHELKETAKALERGLPGNPTRKENEALARLLEADMRDYFEALLAAFPWEGLERLYWEKVKVE